MSYFDQVFAFTMKNEGGYNNNPDDAGGETYKGIARNYAGSWAGWPIIDAYKAAHGPIREEAIIPDARLDPLVKSFYLTNKWNGKNLDAINNLPNAALLFDMSTQHGNWARVANLAIMGNPVTNWFTESVPNALASSTIMAINNDPKGSYNKIANARMAYVIYLNDTGRLADSLINGVKNRVQKFISNAWGFVFSPVGSALGVIAVVGVFF